MRLSEIGRHSRAFFFFGVDRFPAIAWGGAPDYAVNVMKSFQAVICLVIALWAASLCAAPLPVMQRGND
jgi:hypothetical protein